MGPPPTATDELAVIYVPQVSAYGKPIPLENGHSAVQTTDPRFCPQFILDAGVTQATWNELINDLDASRKSLANPMMCMAVTPFAGYGLYAMTKGIQKWLTKCQTAVVKKRLAFYGMGLEMTFESGSHQGQTEHWVEIRPISAKDNPLNNTKERYDGADGDSNPPTPNDTPTSSFTERSAASRDLLGVEISEMSAGSFEDLRKPVDGPTGIETSGPSFKDIASRPTNLRTNSGNKTKLRNVSFSDIGTRPDVDSPVSADGEALDSYAPTETPPETPTGGTPKGSGVTVNPLAETTSEKKLRKELEGLKLMKLQKRAVGEGIEEAVIETAMESDQPKQTLVTLILNTKRSMNLLED